MVKNQEPVLVVMAAGMGSRFGGLKQMTPVDGEGCFIIDYSLYDAYRAGFRRVAFIIKKELEEAFRQTVGHRMERFFEVHYIYQELTRLPEGYAVPEGRQKPWGTAHAVACCRGVVDAPFAAINADDFYGRGAFEAVYRFLKENTDENAYCMAGYRLRNTLTENGSVARGVCEVENGLLTGVTERTKIFKRGENAAFTEDGETFTELSGDALVSMNFWGFTPHFLDVIWDRFPAFLDGGLRENPMKCEFYLPSVVNSELQDGRATVCLLPCDEVWHGVTYKEDLESVVSALAALHREGVYPPRLWE
mgnify:CR=1 FL=1